MTRYVSAKMGLVLKDDWYIIAKGSMTFPIKVTFSDYRMVGGMPVPFRQETDGIQMGRIVIELTWAEPAEETPADVFKPRKSRWASILVRWGMSVGAGACRLPRSVRVRRMLPPPEVLIRTARLWQRSFIRSRESL